MIQWRKTIEEDLGFGVINYEVVRTGLRLAMQIVEFSHSCLLYVLNVTIPGSLRIPHHKSNLCFEQSVV